MSHFIKFLTQYTNAESLEKAFQDLEALGITVVRNKTVKGYSGTYQFAEFGIPRGECYSYNLRKANAQASRSHRGYGGIAFNYSPESEVFEITEDDLDKPLNADVLDILKKRYTRHETVAAMEAMGYKIKSETEDDIQFKPTRATARHLRKRAVGKRSSRRQLRVGR